MKIFVLILVALLVVTVLVVMVRSFTGPKPSGTGARRSSNNSSDHNMFSWFGANDSNSSGSWCSGGDSGGGDSGGGDSGGGGCD